MCATFATPSSSKPIFWLYNRIYGFTNRNSDPICSFFVTQKSSLVYSMDFVSFGFSFDGKPRFFLCSLFYHVSTFILVFLYMDNVYFNQMSLSLLFY